MNKIDEITTKVLQSIKLKPRSKKKKRDVELTGVLSALTRRKISRSLTGRTLSEEHRESISSAMCQVWCVISPTGKNQQVYNLKAFCLNKGLNYSAMVNVATGRLKQHRGGWRCRRAD